MDQQVSGVDLFDPVFKVNAFPAYARLRETEPVSQTRLPDGRTMWVVAGYEEGQAVLKDHHRFANDPRNAMTPEEWEQLLTDYTAGLTEEQQAQARELNEVLGRGLLDLDPPDHSRLRRLVSQSFTPRFVEGLRPRVQEIADELIEAIVERAGETGERETDLIASFAFPLPITVIAEMLGVPTADRDKFRAWSNAAVQGSPTDAADPAITAMLLEFVGYLRQLRAEKLRHPTNDLVSALVQAEAEGDALTENEVLSMVFLLIVAGHETTVNLIGNGMLALFEHPNQMARLQGDPALIKPAIEEFLRYYGPVEMSLPRFARQDLELGGQTIRRGDQLTVLLAAADRDPGLAADPDTLDVGREPVRHLAFGTGIHACLGAPLARLEGQIAFTTLLAALPAIRLAVPREELIWTQSSLLRGLTRLPVAF
jgi:cytochrome P450